MTSDSLPRDITVERPGGRSLGVQLAGAPAGPLVVYMHGSPSSRVDVDYLHDRSARRGIWLAGIDRPGYGRSELIGTDEAAAERLLADGDRPFLDALQLGDAELTDQLAGHAGPADRRVLEAGFGRILAPTMRESMRQGQLGWARDNVVRMGPWNVDLGAIRCPTTIWLGSEDAVNVEGGAWLGARIPHATISVLQGHGHYLIFELWDQVLDSLGLG